MFFNKMFQHFFFNWYFQYFPVYPLTYLVSSYSLWLLSFAVSGMDSLVMGCCLYISGQFELVERQIADLKRSPTITSKLIAIINRHNRSIQLTEKMLKIFNHIILTQFISGSLVTGTITFNIIISSGSDRLRYLCYFSVNVIQIFLFCMIGSILTDSVSPCDLLID
jgi:7tm Odorant receptor